MDMGTFPNNNIFYWIFYLLLIQQIFFHAIFFQFFESCIFPFINNTIYFLDFLVSSSRAAALANIDLCNSNFIFESISLIEQTSLVLHFLL